MMFTSSALAAMRHDAFTFMFLGLGFIVTWEALKLKTQGLPAKIASHIVGLLLLLAGILFLVGLFV